MTAAAPILGYDVSHWRVVDPKRARAEGMRFVLCKATESTTFIDPTYRSQVLGGALAGLLAGGYHFLRPGNGAGQCDYFLSTVGDPDGKLCALDVEDGSYADVLAFVARWRQRTRHPLGGYTGPWFWRGHLGNPPMAGLFDWTWDSTYMTGTGSPQQVYAQVVAGGYAAWTPTYGGLTTKSMLQYSSSATVAGVAQVDVNAWPGTWDELVALSRTSAPKPAPTPTPAPAPTPKDLDMTPAQEAKLDQAIYFSQAALSAINFLFGAAVEGIAYSDGTAFGTPVKAGQPYGVGTKQILDAIQKLTPPAP